MQLTQKQIEKFLKQVMDIQQDHAHEQRNAKSQRLAKIRECLNKFAVEEKRKC
jgi:hypothetical protein